MLFKNYEELYQSGDYELWFLVGDTCLPSNWHKSASPYWKAILSNQNNTSQNHKLIHIKDSLIVEELTSPSNIKLFFKPNLVGNWKNLSKNHFFSLYSEEFLYKLEYIKKSIYIAGPDVFESNAIEIGALYTEMCDDFDFRGLYPLNNELSLSDNATKHEIAEAIYLANIEMINQSDYVIANLNSFRGKEGDSGTMWEVGYAVSKGIPVIGYMDSDKSYLHRFSDSESFEIKNVWVDENGKTIEDFDLPINLMISCSVKKICCGGFQDALIYLHSLDSKA